MKQDQYESSYNSNYFAPSSILDKTDWRKTIHKCLENCVISEGTVHYPKAVKSLISAVSANYPGFNARSIINKYIHYLKIKYAIKTLRIVDLQPDYWFHPGKRQLIEPSIINAYYKELFEYVKNLLAKKRILLYGSRKLSGGKQMPD